MGKIIVMNVTLGIIPEKQVEKLVQTSEIKYLEQGFYLILPEEN